MATGLQQADVTVVDDRTSEQLALLRRCFEQAYGRVDLLSQQPVSTADLRTDETIELLVTAGSLDKEVYGNRLVFLRVAKELDGSLAWLAAVRTFLPEQSPFAGLEQLPTLAGSTSLRDAFDPKELASLAPGHALQEWLHIDEVTKRTLWHTVSSGQYDSPLFCGGAIFSSSAQMLQGLGSVDAAGHFERRMLLGRDVVFPDEFYIEGEMFPRRWPKPVQTFIEGVFGNDRSDELPIGMRRTTAP